MSERPRGRWLALAVAVLSLVGSGCARAAPEREVAAGLAEAEGEMKAGRWAEARVALARAEGRLGKAGPAALRERVAQMRKDVDMVTRLEEVRFRPADASYSAAFRQYGLDLATLKAEDAARRVGAC